MIDQSRERGTSQRLERSVRRELGRELEAGAGHTDTSVRTGFTATMTWEGQSQQAQAYHRDRNGDIFCLSALCNTVPLFCDSWHHNPISTTQSEMIIKELIEISDPIPILPLVWTEFFLLSARRGCTTARWQTVDRNKLCSRVARIFISSPIIPQQA